MDKINSLKVRNFALYNVLKKYVHEVLSLLNECSDGGKKFFNVQEYIWIPVKQSCLFELIQTTRLWYEHILKDIDERVSFVSLVSGVMDELRTDVYWGCHIDKFIGSCFTARCFHSEFLLNDLIRKYVDLSKKIEFNDDIFDCVVAFYEEAFFQNNVEYIRITPLMGIELEKNITISDEMSLEILCHNDISKAIEYGISGADSISFERGILREPCQFALVTRFSVSKIVTDNINDISGAKESEFVWTKFEKDESTVIDLLALILGSRVVSTGYVMKSVNPVFEFVRYGSNGTRAHCYLVNKTIDSAIERDLCNLFNLYNNSISEKWSSLAIAIRRFSLALANDSLDDKLLDIMISAESIFLDDSAELSYRLALRAATILGENCTNRHKIYLFFKEMYQLRSKIVHGKRSFSQFRNDTEKYCEKIDRLVMCIRMALLKILSIMSKNDQVNKLIDWEDVLFQALADSNSFAE